MMRGKQSQEGGDSSLNIQAQGNVSFGLDYSETRQVAMDVFRANFLELRDEAATLAFQRAEALINGFLQQAAADGLTEIPEGKNPDFQYALFSAQKEYARSGDEDLGELLVQLLVDRTKVRERDLQQIVLNESMAVAPKLTPDQLDALSLIFVLKYSVNKRVSSLPLLYEYLDQLVLPFVAGASRKQAAYQHLEFAGCGTIAVTQTEAHAPFAVNYPGLFSQGFTQEELEAVMTLTPEHQSDLFTRCLHNDALLQVNAIRDETTNVVCLDLGIEPEVATKLNELQKQKLMSAPQIKEHLIGSRPNMAQYFELWEETPVKNMTLTSVGIAIAHANIKRKTGDEFADLSIWM